MNTCIDCEFYRSTLVFGDFCTVDNDEVYAGSAICGFYKPVKKSYITHNRQDKVGRRFG